MSAAAVVRVCVLTGQNLPVASPHCPYIREGRLPGISYVALILFSRWNEGCYVSSYTSVVVYFTKAPQTLVGFFTYYWTYLYQDHDLDHSDPNWPVWNVVQDVFGVGPTQTTCVLGTVQILRLPPDD